jgi:hypothetical protein
VGVGGGSSGAERCALCAERCALHAAQPRAASRGFSRSRSSSASERGAKQGRRELLALAPSCATRRRYGLLSKPRCALVRGPGSWKQGARREETRVLLQSTMGCGCGLVAGG